MLRRDAWPSVSAVVPVYNGSYFLDSCVSQLRGYLGQRGGPYEILIAEDGSTDGSKALCLKLHERYPEVTLIQAPVRLGRGESLRRAMSMAKGDIVLYMDVDMATDLRYLDPLIAHVANGHDVATGSRYLSGSHANRRLPRLVASLLYNRMVRLLLDSEITDHQCGFKAFKKRAVLALLPAVESGEWFWDTEILVRAQLQGMRVAEIPVDWTESPADRSTVKLARDSLRFFFEVLRLRGQLNAK